MSYENRIKARIQANKNRLKDIEKTIIELKAKHQEIYYQNELLQEMLDKESEAE
jgi:hypothetical protein